MFSVNRKKGPFLGSTKASVMIKELIKTMKIVDQLKTQEETLKIAKYFAELHQPKPTFLGRALGFVSAVIIYGIGVGFGVYLLFGFFNQ